MSVRQRLGCVSAALPIRKHLILEVTEEFVRDYNRTPPNERAKLNDLIYRMLHRLKVSRGRRRRMKDNRNESRERPVNVKCTAIDQFNCKWLGRFFAPLVDGHRSSFFRAELCLLSQCKSPSQEGLLELE